MELKRLMKAYDCKTPQEYFDLIANAEVVGQQKECMELFINMDRSMRVEFLIDYTVNDPEKIKLISRHMKAQMLRSLK